MSETGNVKLVTTVITEVRYLIDSRHVHAELTRYKSDPWRLNIRIDPSHITGTAEDALDRIDELIAELQALKEYVRKVVKA